MDTPWESEMKSAFAELEEKHGISGRVREFMDKSVNYHGFPAPGVILGAYMIDLALEKLGAAADDKLFAIAETKKCVSDSIGIITGCTSGSSKFLLFESGRISIALGRDDGSGIAKCIRAFVVANKAAEYPALKAWYFNDKGSDPKNDLPALLDDILTAGRSILSWEHVEVNIPPKDSDWEPALCKKCGEMVPDRLISDGMCRACGEGSLYIRKDR